MLPSPTHFEQASELVTREMTADSAPPGRTRRAPRRRPGVRRPGYDEVYVANMGPHYLAMIEAYGSKVLPAIKAG